MENTGKTDRRIRRTRSLLRQGLMKLMSEKDINEISVTELTELVDLNRGTFYLHYDDIYDMLQKIEEELFTEFQQIMNKNFNEEKDSAPDSPSPLGVLQDIFAFLEANRETARVLMGPHGDLNFVNRLTDLVTVHMQNALEPPTGPAYPYCQSFIMSGCVGVIGTWLNEECPLPPGEMASLCSDMIMRGILSPEGQPSTIRYLPSPTSNTSSASRSSVAVAPSTSIPSSSKKAATSAAESTTTAIHSSRKLSASSGVSATGRGNS